MNAFDRNLAALNHANDDVAKAQRLIVLLQDYQKHRLEGVTSKSARFWTEARLYQIADELRSFFGTDDLTGAMDNAACELRHEHSYDIEEECNLGPEGDPIGLSGSWTIGRVGL